MIPNIQKFHHLIFFGFCSTCGIRFLLRFVARPPKIISRGKIHGCLNKRYVATAAIDMMTQVIVFLMEILKAITVAYTKKPTAMGDRKSTRLNSSHSQISYAVFCLKKKNKNITIK